MLHLLGHPYTEADGVRLELPPTKPSCLLLYLACAGDWVGRERLAELFRPDADEGSARHTLRLLLSRAKGWPGAGALEAESTRLRWPVATDLAAFRGALGRGDWAAAVAHYRGPLLDGFPVRGAPGFEAWLGLEREALADAWRKAAAAHARELEAAGHPSEAAALLGRLLEDDLLAEDTVQLALRAHYRAGQREAALRLYGNFREQLAAELGLEPLAETDALVALIRRAEPLREAAFRPAPPIPVAVQHPPRVVGRAEAFGALRAGGAPVTLVAGEPGVGKTRLLAEALPGGLWLRAREGLGAVPYLPLVAHLREHLGGLALEPVYAEELARLVPEAAPGRTPPPPDPQFGKVRLLEAWARLLEGSRASAVVFDDLQWADPATLELLVFLSGRAQLRVFGAYRSTEVGEALGRTLGALRSSGAAAVLELGPLSEADVGALLASLAGESVGPPVFSRWLHGRTGGNPFFALETLKVLFETGVLRVGGEGWSTALDALTGDYAELSVPPRVAETVARRVAALAEPARRVLEAACVVREGFSAETLSPMVALSPGVAAEALAEAEARGLLRAGRFAHDLVRETLYAGLPAPKLAFLHAQVARQGRGEALVVAEHWLAAGETARAVDLWLDTAWRYTTRDLYGEAEGLLGRALRLGDRAARARANAMLAAVLRVTARPEEAEARLAEALAEADEPWTRTLALWILAQLRLNQGRLAEADAAIREAAAHEVDDAGLRRDVTLGRSYVLQAQGAYGASATLLEAAIRALRREPLSHTLAVFLNKLGSDLIYLEQFAAARDALLEARAVAERTGARRQALISVNNLLAAALAAGPLDEAVRLAEGALREGAGDVAPSLHQHLARAYLKSREVARARGHAEAALALSRQPRLQIAAYLTLAELSPDAGPESEAALSRAYDLAAGADLPTLRLRVAKALLNHGAESFTLKARLLLARLDADAVSPDLRAEAARLLEADNV